MPSDPPRLNPEEYRAWRNYLRMRSQLSSRLNQFLLQDNGMSESDYEVLAALSERPEGRMRARDLRCQLLWERSPLSHQTRRMEHAWTHRP